jgi:integrase/recombinase XerD
MFQVRNIGSFSDAKKLKGGITMCKIIEDFKISLIEDGKSIKTIESYVGDTSAFVTFLKGKGVDFNGEMKRLYIASYRNHLIENQYELSTINKKVNSIQSFNKYLVDNG